MSNSSNEDVKFTLTDAQINFSNILLESSTIPGTCVCFLVLIAYVIVASVPKARKHLDRVSFRLLTFTLLFNVLFGIAYAAIPSHPEPGCGFGVFCTNVFLSFMTFFTTCIAINLQLVLVHRVNGQQMEKYYLIGAVLLSLALNVPTYALHQLGWDNDSSTCWYKNPDKKVRLRWIIGTQSFWIVLAATVETICSCVILGWMYLYQRKTRMMQQAILNSSKITTESTNATRRANYTRPTDIRKDPRYRRFILRIALYPIISLIVNYSTVALDLITTIRGLNTEEDFRLLIVDLIMYGIRTLAYGILAAGDPSFISAVREMLGKSQKMHSITGDFNMSTDCRFVISQDVSETSSQPQGTKFIGWNPRLSESHSERGNSNLSLGRTEDSDTLGNHQHIQIEVSNIEDVERNMLPDYEDEFKKLEKQL